MTKAKIIIKTIIRAILYQIIALLLFFVSLLFVNNTDSIGYVILYGSFAICSLMIFLAILKGIKEKKELEIAEEEKIRQERLEQERLRTEEEKRIRQAKLEQERREKEKRIFDNENFIERKIKELINSEYKNSQIEIINSLFGVFAEQLKLDETAICYKYEIHTKFLSKIIQDGRITDDEKYVLHYLENKFNLSNDEIKSNRHNAYKNVFEWATKDKELTESEENVLRNIFSQLEINADDVEKEQNFIADLSLARKLKSQELSPIKVPFNLNQDEQCYFSIQYVALYDSRQKNYEYYPLDKAENEGKFYITNKRIIISSPREYSWLLTGITNIKIYNSRFIQMNVMRRKSPYFISTNKPYLLKTVIEKYLNKLE